MALLVIGGYCGFLLVALIWLLSRKEFRKALITLGIGVVLFFIIFIASRLEKSDEGWQIRWDEINRR